MSDTLPFRQLVRSDLEALVRLKGTHKVGSLVGFIDVLLLPGAWATLLVRLGNALHAAHLRPFSRLVYFANTVLFAVDIAPGVTIGPGLAIPHPTFVGMGSTTVVGRDCVITGGVRLLNGVVVGDRCYLLDGVKVIDPATLGDDVVVGAGSVVLDSLPSNCIAAGVPARVLRGRGEASSGSDAERVVEAELAAARIG